MSANGPSYWDIAGHINNYFYGAAPAVEQVKEAVQQVVEATQEVVEDIKEVATSTNSLGTTESVGTVIPSIAPTVSGMSTALVSYVPTLSSTADMCGLDEVCEAAPSNLGYYALGGLSLVGGMFGLYRISRLLLDTKPLVSPAVHAIAKDSQPALELIKANSKNVVVLELLNNEENMRKLLALEATNKGTLAGFAKMKAAALLVTLQEALAPKVVEHQEEELKEVALNSPIDVLGTQAASSVPSTPVDAPSSSSSSSSSAPAPAPTAMDLVVAKIRQNPKATAVLEQMNERSLKALEKNAAKLVAAPAFMNANDATLTTVLIGAARKVGQEITVEKAAALKM